MSTSNPLYYPERIGTSKKAGPVQFFLFQITKNGRDRSLPFCATLPGYSITSYFLIIGLSFTERGFT